MNSIKKCSLSLSVFSLTKIKFIAILTFVLISNFAISQCGGGYTQASLNWDLQYNNGAFTIGTTGTRFAFGINSLLITTSASGVTSNGDDAGHTGNGGISVNGSGDPRSNYDSKYTIGTGTITFTFNAEVQNVNFTIQDIDASHAVNITAANAASTAQSISMTALGTTTLTLSGNNTTSATATGASGATAANLNNAGVTISISGTVKTVTLSFTKASGTSDIWLSDITGCNLGTFPSTYHNTSAPESGQPEYFLVARDNNIYLVNVTTAAATLFYTDASLTKPSGATYFGINSLACDPTKQVLYYTSEDINTTNKTIYKYDVKTGIKSTFISDVTASPCNIQLATSGLGSGSATFFNGSLYLGFESNQTDGTPAGVYRIDIDNSGNATMASRVFTKIGYNGSQTLGFGDIVTIGSTLYFSNNGSTSSSADGLQLYDINAMAITNNYAGYKGQLSISSNETLRFVDGSSTSTNPTFGNYSGGGNWATGTSITGSGAAYTNDAAEVFKYPSDYGDAPSSYLTAYHLYAIPANIKIKLGAAVDYEISTFNTTLADGDDSNNSGSTDDEDGVSSLATINTGTTSYSVTVSLANTNGSSVSLYGWIDFNRNGTFDAGERSGTTGNIANNATSVTLTWSGLSGLVAGQSYLRLRIGSVNTEVNTPSGKAIDGEIEDYPLTILNYTISGTVYDDANGSIDNTVNGTGKGNPSSTTLYANLLNSSNVVLATTAVASDGTYSFTNLAPGTYKVQVSVNQGTVNSAAPATALPTNWFNTGENIGASAGNDGTTDGTLTGITISNANITNANFGIDNTPTAYAKTFNNQDPSNFLTASGNSTYPRKIGLFDATGSTDGAVNTSNSAILPGKLAGTDSEDGKYAGATGGNAGTVVFTTLPDAANIVLVYNGTLLVAGGGGSGYWNTTNSRYEIANFDNTLLQVFFKPGISGFSFVYGFKDAAGLLGTTATYTVAGSGPLPVKLLYFDALKMNTTSVLTKWATASEINNSHFDVQRSADGKNWLTIGTVNGNGTTNTNQYYSFIDTKPVNGMNYYRLKQVDYNGEWEYSSIRWVNFDRTENNNLLVYPNPATDLVKISLTNEISFDNVFITISDMTGRVVFTNTYDNTTNGQFEETVNLKDFEKGFYQITISNSSYSKTVKVFKF